MRLTICPYMGIPRYMGLMLMTSGISMYWQKGVIRHMMSDKDRIHSQHHCGVRTGQLYPSAKLFYTITEQFTGELHYFTGIIHQ